ncbi:transcription regulator with HTH domain protein [Leptolyngbya sp. NIES-3755]|nr:transcription regulator with HTH domain protein [Leptolyngbya sp. NIES-3755]
MTTGIKAPSDFYLQLITEFPPRPIQDEALLQATQDRINQILSSPLNDDARDYLRVLGMLIYEYEEQTEAFPELTDEERIQALEEDLEN